MIRIAVCDDEKNIRTYLCALIQKQSVECRITEYASAEEYLSDDREYDLLFLDIEFRSRTSGIDGIHLAKQIRNRAHDRQPIIIFVTGYEKYVYDAFDVGAFQYLLKPVDEKKFEEVFQRAAAQIGSERERQQKKLVVQYANAGRAIPLEDIYFIESQGHKAVVHMKEEVVEYYARIGNLEEELQGQFFRIHKGYLVNLAHVEEYNRAEVTLTSGDKLLLSRYKYSDFVKAYMRYMERGGAMI